MLWSCTVVFRCSRCRAAPLLYLLLISWVLPTSCPMTPEHTATRVSNMKYQLDSMINNKQGHLNLFYISTIVYMSWLSCQEVEGIQLGSTDGYKARDHIFQPQRRWMFLMNRWDFASRVCGNTTGYFWWIVGWNQSLQDISSSVCGDTTRHFWQVIGTFSSCDVATDMCEESLGHFRISLMGWLVWTSLWLQNQVFLSQNLIFSGPLNLWKFLLFSPGIHVTCWPRSQEVNSINQKTQTSYWTNLIQGFNI